MDKEEEKPKEEKDIENTKLCEISQDKPVTKEEIKHQNKIMRNFFIAIGIFIVIVLIGFYIANSVKSFEYQGRNYDVIKEGEIIAYHTILPVYTEKIGLITGNIVRGDKVGEYHFYLRNNPRKLEKIEFNGELNILSKMVINTTQEYKETLDPPNCQGYGVIAVANLVQLYKSIGKEVITDENAGCDPEGRYMFLQLLPGEETKIEQFGPSCYNLYINDCEILDVTERFMIETFNQLE